MFVAPRMFPLIVETFGELAEKVRTTVLLVADLWVRLAFKVTPPFRIKVPVPALLNSSQVVFAVIVIVWVSEALASSPTPGITPPVQVVVWLKFPVWALVIKAINSEALGF